MKEIQHSEKNKEIIENYNNILGLKDSIKSDLIKKMLEEEDLKVKEDQNINVDIIVANKNNNKKKNQNNIDKNNLYFPLKKIHPKSKTLKSLMNEHQKNNIIKPKKNIVTKENKNKIKKKNNDIKSLKIIENNNISNKTELKMTETKDTADENNNILNVIGDRYFSPKNEKHKKIFSIKEFIKEKELSHSADKSIQKQKIYDVNKVEKEKSKKHKITIYNEINSNLKNIFNNSNSKREKTIIDFDTFLTENNSFENNYSSQIQKTLKLFKKGNKFFKKNIYLPKYHHYSNKEIIKELIFKDILSFLSPIEQYIFSKSNKDSLVKYMKLKGVEAELLLDKYKNQKKEIEKILNKNQNIKVTRESFFSDHRLNQIFNLLNDDKYLEIFNDKTKVPDDNIIFVFKLFFLTIKGTDKLVDLENDIFWEKISTYFINHTNEFNKNDYLLGELLKKILEKKLDFSEEKIQKIKEIVDQVDLRQINPNTFKDISPTTSQFCFIIGYFMEFFGIIGKDWNPMEIEFKELIQKMNELIKKINKIGVYIVNLKFKNQIK